MPIHCCMMMIYGIYLQFNMQYIKRIQNPSICWLISVILTSSPASTVFILFSVSSCSVFIAFVQDLNSLSEPHRKVTYFLVCSSLKTVVAPPTSSGTTSMSLQFRIGNRSTGDSIGSLK